MFKLSQETIAILTIGLTILGTILYTTARVEDRIDGIQSETRADREALRAEVRADRDALRAEARADRDAFQAEIRRLDDQTRADREAFEKHIIRLTQEQSRLTGMAGQMRTASR